MVENFDKNILLSVGKFLKDNVVCSDKDIQQFLVTDLDYVIVPLPKIREHLKFLEICGFIEKTGEVYSPKYFQYIPKPSVKFDQLPIKMWQRII